MTTAMATGITTGTIPTAIGTAGMAGAVAAISAINAVIVHRVTRRLQAMIGGFRGIFLRLIKGLVGLLLRVVWLLVLIGQDGRCRHGDGEAGSQTDCIACSHLKPPSGLQDITSCRRDDYVGHSVPASWAIQRISSHLTGPFTRRPSAVSRHRRVHGA
jgi:hypothetical protein